MLPAARGSCIAAEKLLSVKSSLWIKFMQRSTVSSALFLVSRLMQGDYSPAVLFEKLSESLAARNRFNSVNEKQTVIIMRIIIYCFC